MDRRFFNLFNLSESQAIQLLDTPQDQIGEEDSRYIAASHLINYPSKDSIEALMRVVQQSGSTLEDRIVRRKSIETLGRLQAKQALPLIHTCLNDEDCYTVENAVWAIGEIGTDNLTILESVAQLLERPGQTYRVIFHTLTKMGYIQALDSIRRFTEDQDPPTASAAITSVCRLTGDYSQMDKVVEMLQHTNVLGRRLSIQDLIDAHHYKAIPDIARCPVSLVFRLRGIRLLGEIGLSSGELTFQQIQPHLEKTLKDHPTDLSFVHEYDHPPSLAFLIKELYETDFGRCYLATQTILESHREDAPAALLSTFAEEARQDYGAHYHVVKLIGWLKYAPAYDLLVEALHHPQPQFQKSRAAAAIALGEIEDPRAIPELRLCLKSRIWDLKYAALLTLEKFGDNDAYNQVEADDDWVVRELAFIKVATDHRT